MGRIGSAEFDRGDWAGAREVLGREDLPEDPGELDPEEARALAADLYEAGWSYREIAPALGIGKSTVGRWLTPDAEGFPGSGGGGGGLIGLLLGAGAVAAVLKVALGKKPPRPGAPRAALRSSTNTEPIRGPRSPAERDGESS